MMKTAKELNALKEELAALNQKLSELTEEEMAEVAGGARKMSEEDEFVIVNREKLPIY